MKPSDRSRRRQGVPHVTIMVVNTGCVGDVILVQIGDHADADLLHAELMAATAAHAVALIVDVTHLGMLGPTGVHLLSAIRSAAGDRGIELHLAGGGPLVRRRMELAGLLNSGTAHVSVASALAALPRSARNGACTKPAQRVDHGLLGHLCLAIAED